MLEAYLQDTSPEAVLQVGGDMRKIKFCFSLLKVSGVKVVIEIVFFSDLMKMYSLLSLKVITRICGASGKAIKMIYCL